MRCLLVRVGGACFAIDARLVVEVVPRISLRALPRRPAYVAGVFNLGGVPVPVVELAVRLGDEPAPPRLSTRIVLVDYPLRGGGTALLGLIVARVSALRDVPVGSPGGGDGLLGPVVRLDDELVQAIDAARVLPEDLRDELFGGRAGRVE